MSTTLPKSVRRTARLAERRHPVLPIKAVVDVLRDRYRGKGTWFSPSAIAAAIPKLEAVEVLRAIQAIADKPFPILITKWVIFGERNKYDPTDPEDQEEFELDASEAFLASQQGTVIHPSTGVLVSAKNRVVLYYVANEDLWGKGK